MVATAIAATNAGAQTGAYDPNLYITDSDIRTLQRNINTVIEPHQAPVSIAEARRIVISSVLSALAEKCNLSWDTQIYLPMMTYFRHSKKYDRRLMTLLGMMHGVKQGYTLAELPAGPCPPQIRDQISRAMSKQN
ncbi:hypothetical protein FHR70_004513 [Microvirga lupini]|uniref:Uncharacterized protein n=1 Tax=Microvirga lupini TaxID=420324 RepID=A0A7W4VQJ4_9HYPH|nr:hypothetical protein [Microvirga lupini]MBB3021417.1 hypothetical protein [Microvirga lupini]